MIKNMTKNTIISSFPLFAETFLQRSTGLITRKFEQQKMDAMVFFHCSSLHSFFMSYKFDIIFVDKSKKVITLYESAAPWKIFNCKCRLFQNCTAIECPENTIKKSGTQTGDIIEWNF